MVNQCRPGGGWQPLDGDDLWFADGQTFQHTIAVDDPWPTGATSWLQIEGTTGHFVDGVLSPDRTEFDYRVDPPGGDHTAVSDRARYAFWVEVPNTEAGTPDIWKWFVGECRRKDT